MANIPILETINGSDLTGTDGTANRTHTIEHVTALTTTLVIIANGVYLHQGDDKDYTISTGVITFLNIIWDEQEIQIQYEYPSTYAGLYLGNNEASVSLFIKNTLNTYLQDPRNTAGGEARTAWCNLDKPRTDATFPRIQIEAIEGSNDIISIGTDYAERTFCYHRIHFYTKKDFKIAVTVNEVSTSVQDETLVAYYFSQIKTALKEYQNENQSLSIDGFKMLSMSPVTYDSDTKLYHGYIVVRYWFFTIPT